VLKILHQLEIKLFRYKICCYFGSWFMWECIGNFVISSSTLWY